MYVCVCECICVSGYQYMRKRYGSLVSYREIIISKHRNFSQLDFSSNMEYMFMNQTSSRCLQG